MKNRHHLAFSLFLLAILFSFPLSTDAQNISLSADAALNFFKDTDAGDFHYSGSFTPKWGYSIAMDLDSIGFKKLPFRIGLFYGHYQGGASLGSGSPGGGFRTNGTVTKKRLGVRFYPLGFKLFRLLNINLGAQMCFRIDDHSEGTWESWTISGNDTNLTIEEKLYKLEEKAYFGLLYRMAYVIILREGLFLTPEVKAYWGLTKEFEKYKSIIRSNHLYLGLGISKCL
jgi:hypothetical protein